MENSSKDVSTYGGIFAILLIILVVAILGYNATQGVLDIQWGLSPGRGFDSTAEVPVEALVDMNKTVIYENLSDEEADVIINQLLQSGKGNFEKIQELEATLLK